MNMMVKPLSLPYQHDVTATTWVINQIIEKIIELAKEHMISLPEEVRLYARVDLAEIADALRNVATWQAIIVNRIGLSPKLKPRVYEQVDYGSFGTFIDYYGVKMNMIIDAAENLTQGQPGDYNLGGNGE